MATLGSIADIRMGVTLRGRGATRPDLNGTYRMVRIGDISEQGTLESGDLLKIEPNTEIAVRFFLRPGDVLFANRGSRNTAAVVNVDIPKLIAGHQFLIVRLRTDVVLADYLAWYLRSPEATAHFRESRKGTLVQILQISDVVTLNVPIPPLHIQRCITEFAALSLKEAELCQRIASLRSQLATSQLLKSAINHSV